MIEIVSINILQFTSENLDTIYAQREEQILHFNNTIRN